MFFGFDFIVLAVFLAENQAGKYLLGTAGIVNFKPLVAAVFAFGVGHYFGDD